jgi:hypothetical protein
MVLLKNWKNLKESYGCCQMASIEVHRHPSFGIQRMMLHHGYSRFSTFSLC